MMNRTIQTYCTVVLAPKRHRWSAALAILATAGLTPLVATAQTVENDPWLVRTPIPDSAYRPANLETIVDAIVGELNQSAQVDLTLAVIGKENSEFFSTVLTGAKRAFGELGVAGTTAVPASSTNPADVITAQISMVESYISQGYDGIGVAPLNTELIAPMTAAVTAGATVISFDSDQGSDRSLYVGTNDALAGATAGRTLAAALSSKSITSGNVVVYGTDRWTAGATRTKSAVAALTDAGYTVKLCMLTDNAWDAAAANQENQEIDGMVDLMKGGIGCGCDNIGTGVDDPGTPEVEGCVATGAETTSQVVGIVGMFSNSYHGATAVQKAGFGGQVEVVAFDFDASTQAYMASGAISATHVQRQFYMGYMLPYMLYAIETIGLGRTKTLLGDTLQADGVMVDTGLDIVRAATMNDYTAFLTSLGVD